MRSPTGGAHRPARPDGPFAAFLRDLRRRTEEPNGVIRLIILYKALTAALLLVATVFLLGLVTDREWAQRLKDVIYLSGLRADNQFLSDLLLRFGLMSKRTTTALGLVSLFYAALETTEVLGLADRRRWAEYLVLLATVLFLPYEAIELAMHLTAGKLLIFVVNIAIAVYLVKAKRLFQDTGAAEEAPVGDLTPRPSP
jgi:uncharacterized membrane protein (DUF2068 family)